MSLVNDFSELKNLSQKLKKNNEKIVSTNGCFDILHKGHLVYLQEAKNLGDILVIGINSDASIKKIKGDLRPINSQMDRAFFLLQLKFVDYVFIFNEQTPVEFLNNLKPNIHVKGADWEDKKIPEQETLKVWNGELKFLQYLKGYSTTSIINKVKTSH